MSGKTKQANRTKNNVRPSSSGRSAELLSNTVNPALVMVGPGNLLPAVFPGLGRPNAEQPLSNEFLLCFKKFHKKDPITKIKALNELKELVAKKEQHEVVNALGNWAHYYPSLTVDMDRKVREATQTCHGVIVRKCGRQVALHIKRLLPAWLMAQHDEHAPVQRIAHADLHATFPDKKLVEAIKFCKVDICNLYMDNLKGNAEYMLSGKKTEDEEERRAQIARVVSGTLRALQLLVSTLPESQETWLWNTLLPLLCANSYWKLASHGSHYVRASFYIVTGAVIDRFCALLPAELARRCARTLVAHPESVASVCVERWRTLLKFMFYIPDFLDLMDSKDLLVKRLWDVFENAAWGEARQLVQLLVPLLNMVPAAMRSGDFYDNMFAALLTGLRQKTLLSDETERELWSGIVADAVRYVCAAHRSDEHVPALAGRAHRAWLASVLTAPEFPAKPVLVTITAAHMASLVRHWVQLGEDGENPAFELIIREFWLNVGFATSVELKKLSADTDDVVKLTAAHIQFVIDLKRNLDAGEEGVADTVREKCLRDLVTAAESLLGFMFDYADKNQLVAKIIPVLLPVLKEFHSSDVLRNLARKFETESIFDFYEKILKLWLENEGQRCVTVVELVFLIVQYLEDEEQHAVFDSFGQLSPEVVRWCLAAALSPRARGTSAGAGADAAASAGARWLRSAAAERALVSLARLHEDEQARELLLTALAHHHDGEVIVSDMAITGIVGTCTEMLNTLIAYDPEITLPEEVVRAGGRGDRGGRRRDAPDPFAPLESRVVFAAQLVHALPGAHTARALPLLLSLFRMTLRVPRGSPLLAVEAWTDALWAWRDAARRLLPAQRAAFVRDALRHIHWHLFQDLEQLNIQRIEHVVSLCPYFVIASDGLAAPTDPGELVVHSRQLLEIEVQSRPAQVPLEIFALQLDVIWGDLSCPFERDNEWIAAVVHDEVTLTKETLMIHVYEILFRALYVRNILLHPVHAEERQDGAPHTWCDAIIAVDYFRDQFCNILHDYAVMNVLYDHYAFWNHYDIIREVKERMDDIVFDIVAQIPADQNEVMTGALGERADAHGYYWAYAKQHYKRTVLTVQRLTEKVEQTLAEIPEDDGDGLHCGVASGQEFTDNPADNSERANSPHSRSSSSFEILDTFESIDTSAANDSIFTDVSNDAIDANILKDDTDATASRVADDKPISNITVRTRASTDDRASCDCHQLHASAEEVFSPLLLDRLKTEFGKQTSSHLSQAAKPNAKLASKCDQAALYVDLLGEMMLKNGYFHDAQMKAAEVKKQKQLAKAKFDQLQDTILTEFEVNGQYKIFDKWSDDPAAYRQLNVDVDEGVLYTAKDFAMVRSYYCLYASAAPHVDQFISDIASESAQCNLDAVINGYYRHNDTMLFERSLQGASWLQLSGTAALLDLLCEAVTSRGWDASALHWDFTNIALCSALNSLALSARMWRDCAVRLALVARPTLELYVRVRRFIGSVRLQCTRRLPAAHVAALPREWSDIFAPDATANVFLLICHVLDSSCRTVTAAQVAILSGLIEASKLLEPSAMPAVLKSGRLTLERAVQAATRALADTCHHGFKYLAYYTLRTLAPTMIKIDETCLAARAAGAASAGSVASAVNVTNATGQLAADEEEGVFSDLTLALYDEHLDQLQELVDAALSNYVVCDDICEIVPHSDSHSVVLGYLLMCVALHRHCELATGDLAVNYGTIFNTHAYVQGILPATLRLLPPGVVHYMAARLPTLHKRFLPWFIRLQDFDLNEACTRTGVSRLACGVLLRALGGPGSAAARGWWAVRRTREANALARLVHVAVAPPLVNHQLAELRARARELGPRAKVTVCWSARSAACALRGEGERAPALRVSLSAAHPLHAPRVLSAQPGPDPHWISLYLGYRNGRVIDAMHMWMKAVSSGLRGSVHCYVCYCTAHPHDGSAPAVTCYQCRNKFHSQCIRRWFKSSNRSNCPVCRTNF